MTKIEIINEMYNVINNNADVFEYPHKHMTEYYADKVRTTKKAELEQWLAKLNAMVEEANEAKTVETEVENDTEYVAETKATKKDILFNCIWGAFRYFSNMERHEVSDDEFTTLVCDMYQTMCGDIDTESEWDEFWEIEESMVTHICEDMGCKQINKNHPNEDCYDTIILS